MMEIFSLTLSDDYIKALDINDTRKLIEEATQWVHDADSEIRDLLGLEEWEPVSANPDYFVEEIRHIPNFRWRIFAAEEINARAGRATAIRATAILHLDKLLEVLDDDAPF